MKRFLSLFLCVATLISSVACSPKNNVDELMGEVIAPDVVDSSSFIATEDNIAPVRIKAVRRAASSNAEYTGLEKSVYDLTASVEPFDAFTAVEWSISFVDPQSVWAKGKNVENFVNIDVQSENKAVVSCLAPFAERIQVIATSVVDPSYHGTCILDYAQRIDSYTVYCGDYVLTQGWFDGYDFIPEAMYSGAVASFDLSDTATVGGMVRVDVRRTSVYTVEDLFAPSMIYSGSFFENKNGAMQSFTYDNFEDYYEIIGRAFYFDYQHEAINWIYYDKHTQKDVYFFELTESEREEYLRRLTGGIIFSFTLKIEGKYSVHTRNVSVEVGI